MNRLIYHLLSSKYGARLEMQILMRQTAKAFRGDGDASKSALIRKQSCDCRSMASASSSRNSRRAEKSGVWRWAAFASARLSNQELLGTYARFTADAARRAVDSGQDMKQLHHR
ncbi:MAG: hypothetical protein LUI07_00025, partial [Lachnospiraceae bacterium]|nr:hypothetical protein [Lachnospiraceae bacterium]